MKDKKVTQTKIIIEGITEEGETFRPSTWAECVSEKLSTFSKRRIKYSPLLQPSVKEGRQCIILDPLLKDSNPALYDSVMNFAKSNHLKICGEDKDSASKE